jgi:hypothetical protein
MSIEHPTGRKAVALRKLEAEARYARERYQLYKAKSYSSRLASHERLRELERTSKLAKGRLDRAKLSLDRERPPLATRLAGRRILRLKN